MEITLNYSGAFCELGYDELEGVNGGINLDYIMTGAIAFGGAIGFINPPLGVFIICVGAGYFFVKGLIN